jgi:hypothetical protein
MWTERTPGALRTWQVTLSKRLDGWGMATDRTFDPAWETRRRQADGQLARRRERSDVCTLHRLPVACDSERPAAEKGQFTTISICGPMMAHWFTSTTRFMSNAREQEQREASPTVAIIDSQSVKSAEKRGPALIRMATTRARRSRARSGIFSSIH